MFGSILHRMIFMELVRVFALSLLGIVGILVMAGVVVEASQQGLSPAQVLAIIPLLVPSFLPYTIPATTLFATCVVYGRLAHDNEILAIQAAGVHLMKVVWPVVLLGGLMSAATMGLYYKLIPYTHYLLRTQFLNEVEESLYAILKKDRCIKMAGLNYSMWVHQVQGTRLLDALFKRRAPNGRYDVIARAQEAYLRYNPAKRELVVHMRHCYLLGENGAGTGYFQDRFWPVDLPPDFGANKNPRSRALSCPALLDRIQEMRTQVEELQTQIALNLVRLSMTKPPDDLPQHIYNLKTAMKQHQQEIFSLQTELHMRPALALGCLGFVLVGCPVGIWFSRSDYLSAFISCFLPIVFIYYPMLLCGTNIAKQGKIPAAVAIWAADALMVLISVGMFRKLLKH